MNESLDLFTVQSASAVVSAVASNSMSFMWRDRWQAIEPPGEEFFAVIDRLYQEPGAWRATETLSAHFSEDMFYFLASRTVCRYASDRYH